MKPDPAMRKAETNGRASVDVYVIGLVRGMGFARTAEASKRPQISCQGWEKATNGCLAYSNDFQTNTQMCYRVNTPHPAT